MKKKSTLIFLLIFSIFTWAGSLLSQNSSPIVRFGLIADIQYADCESNNSRFYRNSLSKLEKCVDDFNREKVEFTINLGDVVDKHINELDSVLIRLNLLDRHVYNLSGNHDYGGVTDNSVLFEKLGMPSDYYSFRKENWIFVMLNTNDIATYANIKGTEKEQELVVMRKRIEVDGRNNGQNWNGGIGRKQMSWLKDILEKAEKSGESVLLFSHHPFYPQTMFTALNDKEILNLITEFSCVKAVFSGHHHAGEFAYFNDIPFTTVEGMVETENENAYGIVTIYENKIVLSGKGKVKSREFKL